MPSAQPSRPTSRWSCPASRTPSARGSSRHAGFAAAYATGAGLANAQYGLPDLGLVSLGEVVDQVGRLTEATRIPVVVDADTGYGGPLSAMRTVRLLERAGAAAIQLEDQEMPKRCGHFDDHALIPTGHMQTKLAAAVDARTDDALVIIARTDARSAYDIDEAIARGRAYVQAGADLLFIEAPRSVEELAAGRPRARRGAAAGQRRRGRQDARAGR